jgi:hypothetical protein
LDDDHHGELGGYFAARLMAAGEETFIFIDCVTTLRNFGLKIVIKQSSLSPLSTEIFQFSRHCVFCKFAAGPQSFNEHNWKGIFLQFAAYLFSNSRLPVT